MPKRLKCNLGEQREKVIQSSCFVQVCLRVLELVSCGVSHVLRPSTPEQMNVPGSLEAFQAR